MAITCLSWFLFFQGQIPLLSFSFPIIDSGIRARYLDFNILIYSMKYTSVLYYFDLLAHHTLLQMANSLLALKLREAIKK